MSEVREDEYNDEQNKNDEINSLFLQDDDEFNTSQSNNQAPIVINSNEEMSPRRHRTNSDDNSNRNRNSNSNSNKKRKHDDDRSRSNNNRNKNRRSNQNNNNRDSRDKRDQNSSKRDSSTEVHLKILIPQSSAGRVIGRGGDRVVQIQKDSHAKVKMSKSNEVHAQSGERVCLVVGSIKNALRAMEMVSSRLDTGESSMDDDRAVQIKMLIPDNTAGLLIGKGGSYIKTIKDSSGAQIQISKHNKDEIERVVTIEGHDDKRYNALRLVVEKISEDPQHSCHSGLVYGSANNNNTSLNRDSNYSNSDNYNQRDSSFNSAPVKEDNTRLEILESLIEKSGGSFNMTAASLNESLMGLGFGTQNAQEIINAISVLMRYGLIPKTPPKTNNMNSLNVLASIMSMAGGSTSNLLNLNNNNSFNKNSRGNNYNNTNNNNNANQSSSFNNVLQQVLSNTNQHSKQNRY